jgi:uncharacterized DUF497 family protein
MTKEGFAWDVRKADSNFAKHGISFYEASEVFDDPMQFVFADNLHSDHEDRFGVIGRIGDGRIIAVVFTLTEHEQIRVISARRAERAEIRFYMKEPDELRDEALEVSQRDDDDFDLSRVDWSKAHRGPIFTVKRGPEWVRLEDHVRVIFQGDEEVNDALKWIMRDARYEFDFEKRAARKRAEAGAGTAPPVPPPVLSDDSSCPRLAEPARKRRGSRRRS